MCAKGLECIDDVCVVNLCGNEVVDDPEECDDGNQTSGDGCENDCTLSTGAAEVVAGDEHVCALFHTGDIKCWGAHDAGQLGYLGQGQDVGDDETPADMPFVNVGGEVVQMSLGSNFTCVLLATDEVKCWGEGQHGRLGQGNEDDLGIAQEPADIPAIDFGGDTPIEISAGDQHACAVMLNGTARCWGRNDHGQLGLPGINMVGDDELPGTVAPINVGDDVDHIAAGRDHTCAILGGGGVLCWGLDDEGQLGTATSTDTIGDNEDPVTSTLVVLPEQAVSIHARYDHTCVGYTTGEMQCWGAGGSGRLGYGDTETVGDNEDVTLLTPLNLGIGEPSHLANGEAHTCARLDPSTQVYCWGEGDNGRLGYGNTNDLFAPEPVPVNLALPLGPAGVTAGAEFTCGRTEGNRVKCWGRNNRGQLGYGAAWDTDLGVAEPIDAVGEVPLE